MLASMVYMGTLMHMSIALDLRAGHLPEDLVAWVQSVPDATKVHVTMRGAIRAPRERVLQRTLLGMGCRITMA